MRQSAMPACRGAHSEPRLRGRHLTSFSLSPRYLLATVEGAQLKNVAALPATARASRVLPVPGGPKRSTPRQGSRIPERESEGHVAWPFVGPQGGNCDARSICVAGHVTREEVWKQERQRHGLAKDALGRVKGCDVVERCPRRGGVQDVVLDDFTELVVHDGCPCVKERERAIQRAHTALPRRHSATFRVEAVRACLGRLEVGLPESS